MAQKVRLMFYRGARAANDVAFDVVCDDMAQACAVFDNVKPFLPEANVVFEGRDFDAAMAEMRERIAA